jgi:hypothetical protein
MLSINSNFIFDQLTYGNTFLLIKIVETDFAEKTYLLPEATVVVGARVVVATSGDSQMKKLRVVQSE